MTVLDVLDDDELLAPAFADGSWRAWRAFLAACHALPLEGEGLDVYRACTARDAAPGAPAREAWVVARRRAGKSRIAALVAVYLACFRSYVAILAPGERGTLPIVAADRRQARTVFRYVLGLLAELLGARCRARAAQLSRRATCSTCSRVPGSGQAHARQRDANAPHARDWSRRCSPERGRCRRRRRCDDRGHVPHPSARRRRPTGMFSVTR